MKKLLPKSSTNPSGFTLIELLVVVAIIAILVVIAISLFAGVQKRARDSRRQAEVDALAKSMEVFKNATNGQYTYLGTDYSKDYPGSNKPEDPKARSGGPSYCIATNGTAIPPFAPSGKPSQADITAWTSGCPGIFDGSIPTSNSDIIPTSPQRYSWTICARLESVEDAFCKSSLSN